MNQYVIIPINAPAFIFLSKENKEDRKKNQRTSPEVGLSSRCTALGLLIIATVPFFGGFKTNGSAALTVIRPWPPFL